MQFSVVCCCNMLKNRWYYWSIFVNLRLLWKAIAHIAPYPCGNRLWIHCLKHCLNDVIVCFTLSFRTSIHAPKVRSNTASRINSSDWLAQEKRKERFVKDLCQICFRKTNNFYFCTSNGKNSIGYGTETSNRHTGL